MNTELSRQSVFDNALAQFCGQFCAPISWLPSHEGASSFLNTNGTCTLIDTGEIAAFVTCYHVWEEWGKYRKQHPNAALLLGLGTGVPLTLTGEEPVDKDKDLDLAVFNVRIAPWQLGTNRFYRIEKWPIPLPAVGDIVAVMGFPGTGRISRRNQVTEWTPKLLCYDISGVSDHNITLAPERNDRKSYDENGVERRHDDLGGMSGSPAFLLGNDGMPMLIGFFYEGKKSDDFIFLKPARWLQQNGTLKWC